MNPKKIFLALSLTGILLLLMLSHAINPLPLEKVQKTSVGDKVLTAGAIKSIDYRPKYLSIYLENFEMEFIVFDTYIPGLNTGKSVQISGRTDSWQNKTQVLVDKITIIQ